MNASKLINLVLRIAVAGEFIGHGLLAIGGKADWVGWIQKFGIADPLLAKQLLLATGIIDVIAAFIMLIRPFPAILLGATFWAFWTALVRPLVGVGWLDFVERSTNWGARLRFYFSSAGLKVGKNGLSKLLARLSARFVRDYLSWPQLFLSKKMGCNSNIPR